MIARRLDVTDLAVASIWYDENREAVEEIGVCDMGMFNISDEASDKVGFIPDEELDIPSVRSIGGHVAKLRGGRRMEGPMQAMLSHRDDSAVAIVACPKHVPYPRIKTNLRSIRGSPPSLTKVKPIIKTK